MCNESDVDRIEEKMCDIKNVDSKFSSFTLNEKIFESFAFASVRKEGIKRLRKIH